MQRAVFLAQVARDPLLGAEAAEHAQRQDGDDEEQQQAGDERHATLYHRPG
jgi:hypothetical protein